VANRKRHDFEPATRDEVEAAVHPFIERFIVKGKKERAMVLFSGRHRGHPDDLHHWIDRNILVDYLDERKAIAAIDEKLLGVYFDVDRHVYRVSLGQACNVDLDDHPEVFVSDNGIFGLVLCTDFDPWLLTRKPQPKPR